MNHSQIVSFIWGVADLIRDTFKRGKYQDVILPLTVLRRLDCVLAPAKEKVLQTVVKFKVKLENLDPQLRRAASFAFYKEYRTALISAAVTGKIDVRAEGSLD